MCIFQASLSLVPKFRKCLINNLVRHLMVTEIKIGKQKLLIHMSFLRKFSKEVSLCSNRSMICTSSLFLLSFICLKNIKIINHV